MITNEEKSNIKKGIVLTYCSLLISILGTFLISNRVLFLIGDTNYGFYSFVLSITSWLTVITTSLNASFVRFSTIDSAKKGNSNRINTIYFKVFVIVSAIILIFGSILIYLLYSNNVLISSYSLEESRIMYIMFELSIINISLNIPFSLFNLFITYNKRFWYIQFVNIFVLLLTYSGHFLIAYFTKNIVYICGYSILTTIFNGIMNYIYSKAVLKIKFEKTYLLQNKQLLKMIILFSGIIVLNTIVDQINSNVDKTLLGFFATPKDVTIYQMGHQFITYMTMMSTAVSGTFVPTIHELEVSNKKEQVNRLFLKISKIQTIIIVLVSFGFLTCGKHFIILWIGEERVSAYYVASALLLLTICPLTMNSSIEIQRARNKHYFRAICYFIVAILNIGLSVLFLKIFKREYSIYACVLGTVISTFISHWISMNIYNAFSMKLPIKNYLINLIIHISFGLLCFAIVYFAFNVVWVFDANHLLLLLIKGGVFTLLYSICILLFDKRIIKEVIKR